MKAARGMTLIELLLASTILSLVMLASLSMYRSGVFAYSHYRERQEKTDTYELLMAQLSIDAAAAKSIEYCNNDRIGLRMPDNTENGMTMPGKLVEYEFRPSPESCLIRSENGAERICAQAVEEILFAVAPDGRVLQVTIRLKGMPRMVCTLPLDAASAMTRPFPGEDNQP